MKFIHIYFNIIDDSLTAKAKQFRFEQIFNIELENSKYFSLLPISVQFESKKKKQFDPQTKNILFEAMNRIQLNIDSLFRAYSKRMPNKRNEMNERIN